MKESLEKSLEKSSQEIFSYCGFFHRSTYSPPNWMTKQFNCHIDQRLDLRLRLYAAHLACTKAQAGARAMSQGIPDWVMAVPPSEVFTMETSVPEDDAAYETYIEGVIADEGNEE